MKGLCHECQIESDGRSFFTAFKALPKEERDEVVVRIAGDRSLRRDLPDLATIAERRRNRHAHSTNTSVSVSKDDERTLVFRADQTVRRKGNGQPAQFGIRSGQK